MRTFYNAVFMPRVEAYVRGTLLKRPAQEQPQQPQPAQGLSQEQQSAAATAVAQASAV